MNRVHSRAIQVERIHGPRRGPAEDQVAVEEPLEIRLAYGPEEQRQQRSISITMRTPGDDIDLALGFLFTEGILSRSADLLRAGPCGPPAPGSGLRNVVRVELAASATVELDRLERNFYTTSSCGVCGKSSLEALRISAAAPVCTDGFRIQASVLHAMPGQLRTAQAVFDDTGGIHAAGLFDASGAMTLVREDVGRHNAVDKLIGRLFAEQRLPVSGHGLMVSGRASFELMQKAMMAGFAMLAAVGAPSSLAVDLAHEFNMGLVGFLRDDRFNVYHRPDLIIGP